MTADTTLRPRLRCPVCGRRAAEAHRPFCSPRCAAADLGRWLSGGYAIPGEAEDALRPDEDRD